MDNNLDKVLKQYYSSKFELKIKEGGLNSEGFDEIKRYLDKYQRLCRELKEDVHKLLDPQFPPSSFSIDDFKATCKSIEEFEELKRTLLSSPTRRNKKFKPSSESQDKDNEENNFLRFLRDYELQKTDVKIKDKKIIDFLNEKFKLSAGECGDSDNFHVMEFWNGCKKSVEPSAEISQAITPKYLEKKKNNHPWRCSLCELPFRFQIGVSLEYFHKHNFQSCTRHVYHVECAAFLKELQPKRCYCLGMTRYEHNNLRIGKVPNCWRK